MHRLVHLSHTVYMVMGSKSLLEDGVSPRRPQSIKQTVYIAIRKMLMLMLSTIGLTTLMSVYSVFGGLVFMNLEAPFEKITRHNMTKARLRYLQTFWKLTMNKSLDTREKWTSAAHEAMVNYTSYVFITTTMHEFDGKLDSEGNSQWNFASSLLFAITVISTIGK